MSQAFQRTTEDFVCEHCGQTVKGSGYTNHCSACLWSKHVDEFPGDRSAYCGGMMKPTSIEIEKGGFVISHKCTVCGYVKRNKTAKDDNLDAVISK